MKMINNRKGLFKAKQNVTQAFIMLNFYNQKLNEYVGIIRRSQKVSHGSILLALTTCGKDCTGCPHVHWEFWFEPVFKHPKMKKKLLKKRLKKGELVLDFTRKKNFPKRTKGHIKEVLKLVKLRNSLLDKFNGLTLTQSSQKKSKLWIDHIKLSDTVH